MNTVDRDLPESLMMVARQIRRTHVAALDPFDLNPSQSRALRVLNRAGDPMRLRDLAERLRIVARSATDVVDSLEEAGLVKRTADPTDRRAVLVCLDDKGRELVASIEDAQRTASAEMFRRLTADEQSQFKALLNKLEGSSAGRD